MSLTTGEYRLVGAPLLGQTHLSVPAYFNLTADLPPWHGDPFLPSSGIAGFATITGGADRLTYEFNNLPNGVCRSCTPATSVFLTPDWTLRVLTSFTLYGDATDGFASVFLALPDGVTAVTTPLPAALPLFATILGAGGLIAWRRKRRAKDIA